MINGLKSERARLGVIGKHRKNVLTLTEDLLNPLGPGRGESTKLPQKAISGQLLAGSCR